MANAPQSSSNDLLLDQKGPIDLLKQKFIYMIISAILLVPGLYFMGKNMATLPTHSPVKLGIDFVGGTIVEYGFPVKVQQSDIPAIRQIFDDLGYTGSVIQIQNQETADAAEDEAPATETTTTTASTVEGSEAEAAPNESIAAGVMDPETSPAKAHGTIESSNPAESVEAPEAAPSTIATQAGVEKHEQPAAVVEGESATEPVPGAVAQTSAGAETADQISEGFDEATGLDAAASQAATENPENGDIKTIVSIRSKQIQGEDGNTITQNLEKQFGSLVLLQRNSIGPSLASELLKNGLLALGCAYILIIGYLTYRFQFDYAVCAIIALLHDTLFVFGVFAILGEVFQTEVDSLFVTGILTVVGFSVHDTIVVFDRLRENARVFYSKKLPFPVVANISVNQTLARSINTSVTTLLTLLALYFFGGDTTKDFMLCMILGILIGTYSSICVASLALIMWREKATVGDSSSSGQAASATSS